MAGDVDAVVVGSGPNGLAAAVTLAAAGLGVRVYEAAPDAGGGCRTSPLTLPGYVNDVCSAVHPLALASPFFRAFDLAGRIELRRPEIAYAHPLDGGRAGLLHGSVEETAAGLAADGPAYRKLMAPVVDAWQDLVRLMLGPPGRRLPHDVPGVAAITAASLKVRGRQLLRTFATDEARGVILGSAAHAEQPLGRFATAPFGLLLTMLAHVTGWPVPVGGSRAITDSLIEALTRMGGEVVTGHEVTDLRELPPSRAVLLDLAARQVADLGGMRMPPLYAAALRAMKPGAGVCKVDYALSGPVPWAAEGCRRSGTVHVGGTYAEIDRAMDEIAAGRHPERPFVLAVEPTVVDPGRAPAGGHVLWAYCGVPPGSDVDMTERIERQLERFAPGFRDLVLDRHVRTAVGYERYNPAYPGGDFTGGAATFRQLLFRPAPRWNPYTTPDRRVFLCSSSTSPGGGVHGMCGYQAAQTALRKVFGVKATPALSTAGRAA